MVVAIGGPTKEVRFPLDRLALGASRPKEGLADAVSRVPLASESFRMVLVSGMKPKGQSEEENE